MSRESLPANPLAAIVAAAKRSLPETTGATAAAAQRAAAPARRVVVADVSGSMGERATGRRKIDALQEALAGVAVPVYLFSSGVREWTPGAALPAPGGGTALDLALARVGQLRPTHVLVISDGHPDRPDAALQAADRLDAQIDVIYCGPDWDREGIAFMRRLARSGGVAQHHRLPSSAAVTRLLGGPR
jgi:hypothetical protein